HPSLAKEGSGSFVRLFKGPCIFLKGHNPLGRFYTFRCFGHERHADTSRNRIAALSLAREIASRQDGNIVLSHQVPREAFIVATRNSAPKVETRVRQTHHEDIGR